MKFSALISTVSFLLLTALTGCGGAVNAKIGGTVNGLSGGTTLVLVNNNLDTLNISTNGNFTFNTSVAPQNAYNVTVQAQPNGQTCTVTLGAGTVSSSGGNVTNIAVNCVTGSPFNSAVSVSISGLAENNKVTLLNSGLDTLVVTGTKDTGAGLSLVQLFPTPLPAGSNYSVSVGIQPVGQTCTVTNGIGQIPTTGSAAAVLVTCQKSA